MSEKILSVDDRADNRYLLETILRGYGYEVESASDGLAALKKLESEHYDAVISDILMPQMDGFALCREIKKRPDFQDIPLIFYSANYTSKPDKALAMKLGASGFISKPARPEAIARAVREALDQRQASESGTRGSVEEPIDDEIFLKDHNERLILKLEEKLSELDALSSRFSRSLEKENLRSSELDRLKTLHREREETTAAMLEQAGKLFYEVDLSTRRLRWRGQTASFKVDSSTSTDPDWEIWRRFIHPEDIKRVKSHRDLVHHQCDMDGAIRSFLLRYRVRSRDFEDTYVEVEDSGCFLPGVHGIASRLVGSISEVVNAQAHALERRQMVSLLEKAREAMLVIDVSGNVTYLNACAKALFGSGVGMTVGGSINDFFPDSYQQLSKPWEQTLENGTWLGELTLVSPDGSEITLDTEWSLLLGEKNAPESVIAICEDITERRRLELELG
jgi:PAS domain S-box-containing protein